MAIILLVIFLVIFVFTGTREVSQGDTVFQRLAEIANDDDVKPHLILFGLVLGFFGIVITALILIFA